MRCSKCRRECSGTESRCIACGETLTKPVVTSRPKSFVTTSALANGAVLDSGHFSILRVLGQGGFGITYLARDTHLRRLVAIKEMYPDGCVRTGSLVMPGGPWTGRRYRMAKDRYLAEARTLAQFQHPTSVASTCRSRTTTPPTW